MQRSKPLNHNMKGLVNRMLVTGSAASETAELVGSAPVAPPYPSLPCKGERSGGPTTTTLALIANDPDNGHRSATLEPLLTKHDIYAPLRLRGGNDDKNSIYTLRLRGGGDVNTPLSSTHLPLIKRRNPETSPEALNFSNHFNDIDTAITTARSILDEMVITGKVGRKWNEMVSQQLDEILISFRKVAEESASAIGQVNARREDLREAITRNAELYQDIGAQREKIRALEDEVAFLKSRKPRSKPDKTSSLATDDGTEMETDAIIVTESPCSGKSRSYAAIANAPKTRPTLPKQKADFPPLITPKNRANLRSDDNNSTNRKTNAKNSNKPKPEGPSAKAKKVKARKAATTTRFVTTDEVSWPDLRKSIEQKIKAPKLHTVKSRTGLILFPGNEETKRALCRTSNLREVMPFAPRIMAKGVESDLDPNEIPWAIANQNEELGLTDKDIENIKPLFKLGPREGHTVNWVLEVRPPTLRKLENSTIYIGMMRCKLKLWDKTPQCYRCQLFGHTSKTCRSGTPICRKCAGEHDSRACTMDIIKCANCKGNHQASSRLCKAKDRATNTVLRRTDFGCTDLTPK